WRGSRARAPRTCIRRCAYVIRATRERHDSTPRAASFRDLVIAAVKELDEAKAVADRIRHQCELAPLVRADRLLDRGAGTHASLDGGVDVVDDEVEMQGCPVT